MCRSLLRLLGGRLLLRRLGLLRGGTLLGRRSLGGPRRLRGRALLLGLSLRRTLLLRGSRSLLGEHIERGHRQRHDRKRGHQRPAAAPCPRNCNMIGHLVLFPCRRLKLIVSREPARRRDTAKISNVMTLLP